MTSARLCTACTTRLRTTSSARYAPRLGIHQPLEWQVPQNPTHPGLAASDEQEGMSLQVGRDEKAYGRRWLRETHAVDGREVVRQRFEGVSAVTADVQVSRRAAESDIVILGG